MVSARGSGPVQQPVAGDGESSRAAAVPEHGGGPTSDAASLLALQRTAGNRAVGALLRARRLAREPTPPPTVGAPDAARADEGVHTGGFTATSAVNAYDSNVRIKQYVEPVRKLAKQVLDDYQAGKLPHMEAREAAAAARNAQLAGVRSNLSPGGRAFSEAIKEEGLTLEQLAVKYAEKAVKVDPAKWGLAVDELLDSSKVAQALERAKGSAEVSEEIMKAAGRTGRAVTVVARVGRVAGPAGMAVGLAISGYEIWEAPPGEHLYVAGREASGFAGGLVGATAGGLAAGWVASLACGPAAPVCAIVVSVGIVGAAGYAGGLAGEEGFEWFSERGLQEMAEAIEAFGAPALVPFAFPVTPFAAGGGIGGLLERDRGNIFAPPSSPPPRSVPIAPWETAPSE